MNEGMWKKRRMLVVLATVISFFFVTVSLMHALVAHDHPHESFASEFGLPVHNVAGEKYFLLLVSAILINTFYRFPTKEFFIISRLRGHARVPTPPRMYTRIFARGILHSKAY